MLEKKNQCAIVVSFPHSTAINYILVPDFYVHNCKRENKALEDKIATYQNKQRKGKLPWRLYIFIKNMHIHIAQSAYV